MHHDSERSGKDQEIARRAQEIWEREGRPEGRDKEHWEQAEQELAGPGRPAEDYGGGEMPGTGKPEPGTGLLEAEAQAGEGRPKRSSKPKEEKSQPIAATPEPEAGKGKGRRGAATGP
jgi:hypothetical protein